MALKHLYSAVLPEDVGVIVPGVPEDSSQIDTRIAPHMFYRVLRCIPNARKMGHTEIQQILEEMHERGYKEAGDMYIYQILFRESDMAAIGIEITSL